MSRFSGSITMHNVAASVGDYGGGLRGDVTEEDWRIPGQAAGRTGDGPPRGEDIRAT